MFDFEKLEVYQVAKGVVLDVLKHLYANQDLDVYIKDEWKKANMNILLHLSEGTGRMTNPDKKHYITIARSAVFECVAILEVTRDLGQLPADKAKDFYDRYEKVSKMLLGMYRSYSD